VTTIIVVADPAVADAAIADRLAVADGVLLARDLTTEPPNELGTEEFAARAAALTSLGLSVEALGEPELRALGMFSMLAVSQGSARPPRLVVMRWNGGKAGAAPIAFVGKGVVFDTGGISIKPAAGMEDMKGDMGGAAAVTGVMRALAARQAKVNAVGILGLVENMPSGSAMRPGDIVRAASGVTIEIVNTDAEGRLVLADALWYVQEKFKPAAVIDLATLTGAIGVALGQDHAGLFSNDDELASRLVSAGLVTGEKLWRMPLGPAYDKLIESRFADIKNTGGRPAGAITAAQFLARFVGKVPWAHLDIAGVALNSPTTETNAGWTSGFGVTLLDRLVRDNYEER
jgi:leucyl aminopeptidase